jgi:hypothetical protein
MLDDIYDSYGTPKECEIFTKCIERYVFISLLKNIYSYLLLVVTIESSI